MNVDDFLDRLTDFVRDCTKEIRLPVRATQSNREPELRAPEVFKMRLPDAKSYKDKAPYIIVQVTSWNDYQYERRRGECECTVRMVFCVYCDDESSGALHVLNVMQDIRERTLRYRIVGNQYELDLSEGMTFEIYTDDTAPYFGGECTSVWKIPTIARESRPWLDNVMYPPSPNYEG